MARSITSPLRYPGGKQRLVKEIQKHLPKEDFWEYREPFVGGGSVFFHMKNLGKGRSYWLNDLFEPVANFWKEMNPPVIDAPNPTLFQRVRTLVATYPGKQLFDHIRANYHNVDKTERAAMFFCLNRITFSGLTFSGGYSQASRDSRLKESHIKMLERSSQRTFGVEVTNFDYNVLLEAPSIVPGKSVFIYLDPPYDIDSSNLYGNKGNTHKTFDHAKFAQDCQRCEHKWLITYNDSQEIRDLFKGFARIIEVPVTYNMNSQNKKKIELFICNY